MRWLILGSCLLASCATPPADGPDFIVDESQSSDPPPADPEPEPVEEVEQEEPEAPTTPPTPPPPDSVVSTLMNGDFSSQFQYWNQEGDRFGFVVKSGKSRVTTFCPTLGDKCTGKVWQDFTVGETVNELRFVVHGGEGRVNLIHDGKVIGWAAGPKRNDPEVTINWNIAGYRKQRLRIEINDSLTGPWGFIAAGGFELR